MKSTIDAVRYGIETLEVSPDEMFSLIKSSNGYTGDDYRRWLANEIIKIAEKDGVGYSQLLVKKFSIISSIYEGIDVSMKPEWVDYVKGVVGDGLSVSINFPEFGEVREDVDWFSGLDFLSDKVFSDKVFEDTEILDNLYSEDRKKFSFYAKLDSGAVGSKSSDLLKSAKDMGILCRNSGSLLLYRMCNFVESWDLGDEFTFTFFVNVDFLCDSDNKDIIRYFLKYFNYTGFTVDSSELLKESYMNGVYAFLVCRPRTYGSEMQDSFVLDSMRLVSGGAVPSGVYRRYSRSERSLLGSLSGSGDSVNVLGYLNVPYTNVFDCTVSVLAGEGFRYNIPITSGNLRSVVIYYSIVHALSGGGMSSDVKELMDGSLDYDNLFYNCLPLFLFDTSSLFRSYPGIENPFDVENSDLIKGLIEDGEVYFSYEAKDLLSVCKGFLDYLGKDCEGMTFEQVRKEANHSELNNAYLSALINIKDYIRSLYKKFE